MTASLSTPLHAAVKNPDELCRLLEELEEGALQYDEYRCSDGRPGLLHCAVMCGNLDSVLLLLKHGADINEVDSQGRTPLIQASSEGELKVAQSLIAAGAVVNHQDYDGQNCCHWAFCMDHTELGDWLVSNTKVDTGAVDSEGRTPLHWRDGVDTDGADVAENEGKEAGSSQLPTASAGFVINATRDNLFAAGSGLRATRFLRENNEVVVLDCADTRVGKAEGCE